MLRSSAWSAVGYLMVVFVLIRVGGLVAEPAPRAGWPARTALVVIAILVLLLATRESSGRRPSTDRLVAALLGGGLAWTVLGVLDMHGFELLEVPHDSLAWDAVFHGVGFAALLAGSVLRVRRGSPLRPRPARSRTSGVASTRTLAKGA